MKESFKLDSTAWICLFATVLFWLAAVVSCFAVSVYLPYLVVAALSGLCVGITNWLFNRQERFLLWGLTIAFMIAPQIVSRSYWIDSLPHSWLSYAQYFGVHFGIAIPLYLFLWTNWKGR